jgi:hypothetical protein
VALNGAAAAAEFTPIKAAQFQTVEINGAEGSLTETNGGLRLINKTTNDSAAFFASRKFSGNGQVIARIHQEASSTATAGVLFRSNSNSDSPFAGMFLSGDKITFERQLSTNEPTTSTVATNENAQWLRVVREGTAFSGFYSDDGTNWIQISADTIEMPDEISAGFAVTGKGEVAFDEIRTASAHLARPLDNASFVVPTNILIEADVSAFRCEPKLVEFFSGAIKIGEATQSPFTLIWSNALAGYHSLTAKITDNTDADFFTEPANCEIGLPPAKVKFVGIDSVTRGNWIGKYGAEGFHIIQHATNYPAYAEVSSSGHKSALVLYDSNNPGALQFTNKADRIAAHWHSYSNMTVNVSILDGRSHQVAIYCQDWGHDNVRVQTIEVLDANSREVLDQRRVAEFTIGKYLVWNIQGAVKFRITTVISQAVISGIFFDPPAR